MCLAFQRVSIGMSVIFDPSRRQSNVLSTPSLFGAWGSQAASEPCMQRRPFLLCLFVLFHQLTLVLMHVERNLNNFNFDL